MDNQILQSQAEESDPIAMWLERQLQTAIKGMFPERIILGHLNVHDVSAPMDRFAIQNHDADAARRMTSQLRYLARMDAEQRGGLHRYAVQVLWPEEAQEPPTYFAFSVDGSIVRHGEMTAATEPANQEGIIKMLMRHLELTTKLALQQSYESQEAALNRERIKDERIAELESGRMRVIELQESMLSAQTERHIAQQQAEAAERRKEQALTEFLSLGKAMQPVVASALTRLTGGDKKQATHEQLRVMFHRMSIDDLKAWLGPMKAEDQMSWLQLYREVMGVPKDATPSNETPKESTH